MTHDICLLRISFYVMGAFLNCSEIRKIFKLSLKYSTELMWSVESLCLAMVAGF